MALRTDKVKIPYPAEPSTDREWENFVTRIATRTLTHTRGMLSNSSGSERDWRIDIKITAARTAVDGAMVQLSLNHPACGGRLQIAKVLDRTLLLGDNVADALADGMVTQALAKAHTHMRRCIVAVSAPPPVTLPNIPAVARAMMPPELIRDMTLAPLSKPRKPKPKAKACVVCDAGTDDQFPEWKDDCSHTPKERKGK